MSHSPIRKDKTCLNCRHVVENRFCPNCGQENIDTRKTFHHLFVHFFEDLTHYENAFWKTIRNLLTKPGSLTQAYLSGKRMSYLAPVRLYIFISFITFLVISMLPDKDFDDAIKKDTANDSIAVSQVLKKDENFGKQFDIETLHQLDSVQKYGKEEDQLSDFEYWFAKRASVVGEKFTFAEVLEKFKESFFHNFPKVLFLYMPIFAFVLWIFHDKKKWFYFDHGIFTLHYFSFLLLCYLIISIVNSSLNSIGDFTTIKIISGILNFFVLLYMLYYFFPAHHRFYGGRRRVTVVKGVLMKLINFFLAGLIMILFILYTFINLH